MLFKDRRDAGKQLARALKKYKNAPETQLIALPRGGVVVGNVLAQELLLPLDIVSPRKIGAPFNQELAIGAITETGEGIFSEKLIADFQISKEYISGAIEKEKKEALWRLNHYRKNRPPRDLKNKRVIIVDDGVATGSTMFAALKTVQGEGAKEVILALPVAPFDTLELLKKKASCVVCLYSPDNFYAVGQFYQEFSQTTDEEVIALLKDK